MKMHSVRLKTLRHRKACRRYASSNVIKKLSLGIRKRRANLKRNPLRSTTKANITKVKMEAEESCKQGLPILATSDISVKNQDSSKEPQHFNELLGSLRKAITTTEPDAQLDLWKTMIANHPFNIRQLITLRSAIEERIRFDIISFVPYEIARYIMSFLSPKDLCQAGQTCKSWRTVCEDNRLWREKCKEEGLLDDELTLDALFKERIINTHKKHERFLNETLPSPSINKSEWKVAYLKHMNILRNWRTRNFKISAPFIAPIPMQVEQTQPQPQLQPLRPVEILNNSASTNKSEHSPVLTLRAAARRVADMLASNSGLQKLRRSPRFLSANVSGDDLSIAGVIKDDGVNINIVSDTELHEGKILNNSDTTVVKSYLMQLRCHEDSVITCLQYNPRTNTIVSGSDDQTLKVWSSVTGRCITTLEGHTGGVWSSQLSPEDIVISGSTDRTLKVWRAHTGQLMHTLYGHTSTVRCLALDGEHVVSGSRDTTLRLWNVIEGNCVHVFLGHTAAVRCVEYKNDTIVSGAYDHLVMVWNAVTGTCCHALECHVSRIYSLQFDGKTIASGSLDSTICIWDAMTGKLRHRLAGHTSLTSKMQLNGHLLVSANADSYCKVWDINKGECLQTLGGEPNGHKSAITSVYFNNRHVVTSSDDGTVKLWDIRNGEFIKNLIVLPTAAKGGVVWRIRASYTKLICAVGSRTQTEDTHLLVLDFNA